MSLASLESHRTDPYGIPHQVQWSFPKASRFRPHKASSQADFLSLPSSFSRSHSPGMGYGKRWEPRNPAGKDAPPAGAYITKSCFDLAMIGPIFGKASKRLSKKDLPKSETPGPGQYRAQRSIGENAPKFSMQSRHHMRPKAETPSPGHYSPNTSMTERMYYAGAAFGYGGRKFLAKLGMH